MNHPDIFIPDRAGLDRKLSLFSRNNTKAVVDLDGTITRPETTSWALLNQLEELMPGYNQAAKDIHRIYHPYESDHSIPKERKNQLMQEWWSRAAGLFSVYGIRADYLKEIRTEQVFLRDGMREAFESFGSYNIPVHILSAGIHQTIEIILSHHGIAGDHITLTANQFVFDTKGDYIGFHPKQHIHADNKDEQATIRSALSQFQGRSHTILLGDNPPDIKMIQPLERANTIAVGFCHNPINRDVYAGIFDIVVSSNTSDLGVLNQLLSRISK